MLHPRTLSIAAALLIGVGPAVQAATPCDWEATRKRNVQEMACQDALGPKTAQWNERDTAHLAKLEQCLLKLKFEHRVERYQCSQAEMAKSGARK